METLLPLALFAFVSSITPGPNNIMLTSSGIRFGFVRTLPHMAGITIGFGSLIALCAAGIGSLIVALPWLQLALRVFASAYLLTLAWQLHRLSIGEAAERQVPMSVWGAATFQFINPKAWMMAITGASAFLPPMQPVVIAVLLLVLVFCAINFVCISAWAGAGAALRKHLAQPRWRTLFGNVMAMLTVYAAASLWLP